MRVTLEMIDMIMRYDEEISKLYEKQLAVLDAYPKVICSSKKSIKLEDNKIYLVAFCSKNDNELYLKNKHTDSDTSLKFFKISKKNNAEMLQKGIPVIVGQLRTTVGDRNYYHTISIEKNGYEYKLLVLSQVYSVEVPNQTYRDSVVKEYIMYNDDVELMLNGISLKNLNL